MAYFEKSLAAIKTFDSSMKAAHETHAAAKKQIMANYNGNLMSQKLGEINTALQNAEVEQKSILKETFAADFAQAKAQINATATADAPDNFISTLEAIKALGSSVTEYEIKAYLDKYRSNYIAARAIAEVIGKAGNGKFIIIRLDQIAEEVDKIHNQLINWVQGWNPTSYMSRVMVTDNNVLTILENSVQEWLDGGFVRTMFAN